MKVEFKQACEIEGRVFGPDMRKKPGVSEVPGYFLLLDYFVSLLKSGMLKIIDVSEDEFSEVPEKYKDVEPDSLVISIVEGILMSKQPKEESEEGEESEEDLNSPSSSDSSDEPEEGKSEQQSEPESDQVHKELSENQDADKEVSPKDEQKEVDEERLKELLKKVKRLSNKERKELTELKSKLKR